MIKNAQDKGPDSLKGSPNKRNLHLEKADTVADNLTEEERAMVTQNGDSKLVAIYCLCKHMAYKAGADSKRTAGKKDMARMIMKVLEQE